MIEAKRAKTKECEKNLLEVLERSQNGGLKTFSLND
jgi:hypothetical protein